MTRFRTIGQRTMWAAIATCAALTGCGGEQTGKAADSAADASSSGGANLVSSRTASGVSISGTPGTSATVGVAYSFTPELSNGAGATFSVANKPAWATFDPSTGALTGTPGPSDIGDFNAIVIAATAGDSTKALPEFRITVANSSNVGAATLSWVPPTQNTDGSSVSNLAGYVIYVGTDLTAMNTKIQVSNPGLTS
jgi:hypothetical protein